MIKLNIEVIKIHEPFAKYLGNPPEIIDFEVSLMDVARLSGHLCPSVAGAFLLASKAIELLYPETGSCIRGQLEVHLPGPANEGPLGPMANVFSFITGAWAETGFGGLGGTQYARRNLLHFASPLCQNQEFVFIRRDNKRSVSLLFNPKPILQQMKHDTLGMNFQDAWQENIRAILTSKDAVVSPSSCEVKNS